MLVASIPTSRHTVAVTSGLSPVITLTSMPCEARLRSAGFAEAFGGSRKVRIPTTRHLHLVFDRVLDLTAHRAQRLQYRVSRPRVPACRASCVRRRLPQSRRAECSVSVRRSVPTISHSETLRISSIAPFVTINVSVVALRDHNRHPAPREIERHLVDEFEAAHRAVEIVASCVENTASSRRFRSPSESASSRSPTRACDRSTGRRCRGDAQARSGPR